LPPLLRVEGLKVYFHMPRGVVRAVDDVNIYLNKGEIIERQRQEHVSPGLNEADNAARLHRGR